VGVTRATDPIVPPEDLPPLKKYVVMTHMQTLYPKVFEEMGIRQASFVSVDEYLMRLSDTTGETFEEGLVRIAVGNTKPKERVSLDMSKVGEGMLNNIRQENLQQELPISADNVYISHDLELNRKKQRVRKQKTQLRPSRGPEVVSAWQPGIRSRSGTPLPKPTVKRSQLPGSRKHKL